MTLLDYEQLQSWVDYSFGDHSGVLGGIPNAYMKKANSTNLEFADLCYEKDGQLMTLFIDNIRLYRRPIEYGDWLHLKKLSVEDKEWLKQFEDEDLLRLCGLFPDVKFVIFTAYEDTPLDHYIWDKIPHNVISINSTNSVVFGGKIKPMPHGLERYMYHGYNHHHILEEYIDKNIKPQNQLFVCHREDTGDRKKLRPMFQDKSWATVAPKLDYEPYLQGIKEHKFILCPSGHGIGSARNWETLYMRRVPILEDHPYKRQVFKDFPVLYVKDYSEVTEQLLKDNEHLFEEAQKFSMDLLDLKKIYDLRLL